MNVPVLEPPNSSTKNNWNWDTLLSLAGKQLVFSLTL